MDVEGNIPDLEKNDDGKTMKTEKLELWFRNPIECIRELLGNPMFKDVTFYEPVKLYRDADGKTRVFNEMWTGDWWWEIQVGLSIECTVRPLMIISGQIERRQGNRCAHHHLIRQDTALSLPRRQECMAGLHHHREHLQRNSP
jgi:hypothetical protein